MQKSLMLLFSAALTLAGCANTTETADTTSTSTVATSTAPATVATPLVDTSDARKQQLENEHDAAINMLMNSLKTAK